MGLSADAHSIFRHAVDPRRVSAPAARTLNSFTATTAPAVASTASANAAHGEGRANASTRSRPSCRPRSMMAG